MIPALVAAGICLFMLFFSIVYSRKDLIELIILSVTAFCGMYVIVSGVLFWVNEFSIASALAGSIVLEAVLSAVAAVALKRMPSVVFHFTRSVIPLFVFLGAFVFMGYKYQWFGMGQDQGVYQVKAMELLYGYNDNYVTFDEYDRLTNEYDIESYEQEAVKSMTGFYGYDPAIPIVDSSDYPSKMTGMFHGIPTFAALLALFASLFGYSHMAGIQTVFMCCAIFMMYYVMRNLYIKKHLRIAALITLSFSPIVLWVAKTTLTEMFIMVLLLWYLYIMVDRKYPQYVAASAFPLVVFAFFHVTIYTVMPLFVLCFWAMFYVTWDRRYLYANLGVLFGYFAGFFMMRASSPVYTYGNYKKIFVLGINAGNLSLVVTLVVLFCAAVTVLVLVLPKSRQESFREGVTVLIRRHMRLVMRIVFVLSIVALAATFALTGMEWNHSTFYAYVISTGIVAIPFLFAAFLYKPQFITAHKDHLLLTLMFVYMVIMYSCVFKPALAFYYYYARYIVPYLPVIIILAALRFSRADVRFGFLGSVLPVALSVAFALLMVPYDCALVAQSDVTNMDWEIITDLSQVFEEGDAVIINSSLSASLKFPIKIMTKADTYPVAENLRDQIARLEEDHENVYYVTDEEWFLFKNYRLDNIYSNVNTIWENTEEATDSNARKGKVIPFPTKFSATRQMVNVYECHSDF
jgi:hypothetical protein